MNYLLKGKINLIVAIIALAMSVILFCGVQDIEGEWTFFFDENAQDAVKVLTLFAWVGIAIAFEQFINAAINFTKAENENTRNSDHKNQTDIQAAADFSPSKNNKENIDTSKMSECIFCGKLTDKDDPICQHCGRRQD